ncbi:MAG: AraC family transcriptional regulator [Flavobacteriales bacterium]|nr:AraC family transcriptional regulator [Flavobacteriales bacterium]
MVRDVQPENALLRKHVVGFNMFEDHSPVRFYAYPQLGATVEFLKNAYLSCDRASITVKPLENTGNRDTYAVVIYGKYATPVLINYEGYVDHFGVNFNATGISCFFDTPYKALAPLNFQLYSNPGWQTFASRLFAFHGFEERMAFTEQFLLDRFKPISPPGIEKAVELIVEDPAVHISELPDRCGMSSRSLLRKFNDFVGCSPVLFKRIVRFRNAIDLESRQSKNLNCTDICYQHHFFDTAHFRKEFLKLTHQTPTAFFQNISAVGNHGFPYQLV